MSGVLGNVISLVTVLIAMLVLSWPITVGALILLPDLHSAGEMDGASLAVLDPRTDAAERRHEHTNDGKVQRFWCPVGEALLVVRQMKTHRSVTSPEEFAISAFGSRWPTGTSSLRSPGCRTSDCHGLRLRGNAVIRGVMTLGTLLALAGLLAQLYGPLTSPSNVRVDVMTALVSFERVFEVLDLPPLVTEKPDAKVLPTGPAAAEFAHVDFAYPRAEEVSLASLESVARTTSRQDGPVLQDVSFRVEPAKCSR